MLKSLITVGMAKNNVWNHCGITRMLSSSKTKYLRLTSNRVECRIVRSLTTYKAAVCTELGRPLSIQDVPSPKSIGKDMVKVKVHCSAMNFSDILRIAGKYQEKTEPPYIPGVEFAGEVLEVGKAVQHLSPGDNVFGIGTGTTAGCFAEQVIIPGMALGHMPPGMTMETGASFLIAYGTALMALQRLGQIQPGQTVLVTAAAGAVGLATVDLAANVFGATVIGACGGTYKCTLAEKYGAVTSIDYNRNSIKKSIQVFTKGKGVDLAVDMVGGEEFNECVSSVAFEGRLIVVGFASGKIPEFSMNRLLVKNISVHGLYWGSYAEKNPKAYANSVIQAAQLVSEGKVKPHVSKVFPLLKINEALKYILDRRSTGKVLIDCRL